MRTHLVLAASLLAAAGLLPTATATGAVTIFVTDVRTTPSVPLYRFDVVPGGDPTPSTVVTVPAGSAIRSFAVFGTGVGEPFYDFQPYNLPDGALLPGPDWGIASTYRYDGQTPLWQSDDDAIQTAIQAALAAEPTWLDGYTGAWTFKNFANTGNLDETALYSGFFGVGFTNSPVLALAEDGRYAFGIAGDTLTLVPLPAALPLFVSALVGLGLLGRRARARR